MSCCFLDRVSEKVTGKCMCSVFTLQCVRILDGYIIVWLYFKNLDKGFRDALIFYSSFSYAHAYMCTPICSSSTCTGTVYLKIFQRIISKILVHYWCTTTAIWNGNICLSCVWRKSNTPESTREVITRLCAIYVHCMRMYVCLVVFQCLSLSTFFLLPRLYENEKGLV